MLITLQSNSDSDANQFTNFFKEPVQIQPNSEVALVSIAYKFENTIVIDATNDTFNIQLGTENLTVTVAQGNYNSDTFLAALNTALDTAIAAGAYRTQQAFPSGDSQFAWANGTKTQLKLALSYSPGNWDDDDGLINDSYDGVTVRKEVFLDDPNMMDNDGDGIIIKVSTAASNWSNNTGIAGLADGSVSNALWGTGAGLPTAPVGNIKFSSLGTEYDSFVGLSDTNGTIPTSAEWEATTSVELKAGIRLASNGTFTIEEYSTTTGVLEVITTAPQPYTKGARFEIRVPQEPSDDYFLYFLDGTEITTIDAAAIRYEPAEGEKLYPRVSNYNQVLADGIVPGPGSTNNYSLDDTLDVTSSVITNPGTDYKVNDVVTITGNGSGSIVDAYVNAIDVNGGIIDLTIIEHVEGWTGGDGACTVVGTVSGNGDCLLDVKTESSAEIMAAGTLYIAAAADIYADDGVTVLAAGGVTIDTVGGGGEITDFTWNVALPNTVIGVGYELQIHQGGNTNARVQIHSVDTDIARVGGIQWTTVPDTVDYPLQEHQNSEFTPSAGFQSLTLLPAANSAGPTLIETGVAGVNGDRETEKMLVNIDQFQIASICKDGGVQKAVGMVPYGARVPAETPAPRLDGEFFEEPYNILYHELGNPGVENHNQIQVRLTDATGNPLIQLLHPTTVTLDLRPKSKF